MVVAAQGAPSPFHVVPEGRQRVAWWRKPQAAWRERPRSPGGAEGARGHCRPSGATAPFVPRYLGLAPPGYTLPSLRDYREQEQYGRRPELLRTVKLIPLALCLVLSGECRAEPEPGPDKAPGPVQLLVELTDGSRLLGTTSLKAVPLDTGYATVEVRLRQIRKLEHAADRSKGTLTMQNGDRLTGELRLADMPLTTLLGQVVVPATRICRITGVAADGPLAGLRAYYSGEGDTRDGSLNGLHASNSGAAWAADRHGHPKGAFLFNGKRGHLKIADHQTLDTDDAFTVCAWIKGSDRLHHGKRQIVDKWYSSPYGGKPGNGDYLLRLRKGGYLSLEVCNSDRGFLWDEVVSESVVPTGVWVHVAGTFNRGRMKLYIGGDLEAERVSAQVKQTTRKVWVGLHHDRWALGPLQCL